MLQLTELLTFLIVNVATGSVEAPQHAGYDTVWHIRLIIILIILLYIPLRKFALISFALKVQDDQFVRAFREGNAVVMFGLLATGLVLYFADKIEVHFILLLAIMILLGLTGAWLIWARMSSLETNKEGDKATTRAELLDNPPIMFDYSEQQMIKEKRYSELANRLNRKAEKGKWFVSFLGFLIFIFGVLAVGWFYVTKGSVPWTLGLFIILGPALMVMELKTRRQMHDAAELLFKLENTN